MLIVKLQTCHNKFVFCEKTLLSWVFNVDFVEMDMKFLRLLLEEMREFPFLYDNKNVNYKNVKSKQDHIDAFTLIAANIIEKNSRYFYISGKIISILIF